MYLYTNISIQTQFTVVFIGFKELAKRIHFGTSNCCILYSLCVYLCIFTDMTQTDENCKFCISHILLICNGGKFPHGSEQQALNYAVSQGQVDDGHRAQAANSRFKS